MTRLPFQKPKFRLHGDKEKAQRYVGSATALLHQVEMIMASSGVPVFSSTKNLDDGAVIYAGVFGQERIIEVWPDGYEDENPDELRSELINALAWFPVGFSISFQESEHQRWQKIITPLAGNNYPEMVFTKYTPNARFNYAPAFYSNPLEIRYQGHSVVTKIVGVGERRFQDRPKFSLNIFSNDISNPPYIWTVHDSESMPYSEIYRGDLLGAASSVIYPSNVTVPFRGGYSAYIGRFAGSNVPPSISTARSSMINTIIGAPVPVDQLQAGVDAVVGVMSDSFEGSKWILEFGGSESLYTALSLQYFSFNHGNPTKTQWGSMSFATKPASGHVGQGLIRVAEATGIFRIAVSVYGRVLALTYYLTVDRVIIGAAIVGDGEFAAITYHRSSHTISYDLWSLKDISKPVAETPYALPARCGSVSPAVFSWDGLSCSVLLWVREPVSNSYLDANSVRFGDRRTYAGVDEDWFGIRTTTVSFTGGGWSASLPSGAWVDCDATHTDRTATQNDFAVFGFSPTSALDDLIAGYSSPANWTLRINRYHYKVDGEMISGITYDGNSLISSSTRVKINIECESDILIWSALAGVSEPNYGTQLMIAGLPLFMRDKPESTARPNILIYEYDKWISVAGELIPVERLHLTDSTGEYPVISGDAFFRFYQHYSLLDPTESTYIEYKVVGGSLNAPVMEASIFNLGIVERVYTDVLSIPVSATRSSRYGLFRATLIPAASIFMITVDAGASGQPIQFTTVAQIDPYADSNSAAASNQSTGVGRPPALAKIATGHWCNLSPSALSGFSNVVSSIGMTNTDVTGIQANTEAGNARISFDPDGCAANVRGESFRCFKIRQLESSEHYYFNWSTLDLNSLLGVNDDADIFPVGVLSE